MEGQRLNPFEHALKRPDTYIGSALTQEGVQWAFDPESQVIVRKKMHYNPGLVRIFVEILSNAIDNRWRSEVQGPVMKRIDIKADTDTGQISVWNDGADISTAKCTFVYTDPITQQKIRDELYPAQLYFGYMLAGTNYDDDQKRKTSGRNGMGAKAANVFSKEFTVEHASARGRRKRTFRYAENLTIRFPPEEEPFRCKFGYTLVSFKPDYEFFGYHWGMDAPLQSLIEKLACDCAMITGLHVTFNGRKISLGSLEKYVALYYPRAPVLRLAGPEGEAVLVDTAAEAPEETVPSLPQISFVNGVGTEDGGVHVKAWQDAFVGSFVRYFNARKGKTTGQQLKVSARDIYPYLMVFVRCEVENPTFQSQTKTCLASPTPAVTRMDKKGFERMMKWPFAKRLVEKLEEKTLRLQSRKESAGKRVLAFGSKADDANWAGTRRSAQCTLFITEGQSAKAFATAGIATLPQGHDKNGAFAIKGKFINATNNSALRLGDNKEVQALARILGLERDRDYSQDEAYRRLRYGTVCFLTDADDDGIHIRGLLINFFASQYPSLWKRTKPFFCSMSTPVNRVQYAGRKKPLYFYCTPDFLAWQASAPQAKPASVLYIKGLGTMTSAHAKREFANPKTIAYVAEHTPAEMREMKLGFDGLCSGLRKEWIRAELKKRQQRPAGLSQFAGTMTLSSFINEQVIVYHCTALTRALPSFIDGLKESQRKILFGCFLKKLKKPAKVDQLAGFIAERTGYRHGGVSLQETIVKMAQGFVGSNNVPLLQNAGQFGSRAQGGADAAASRYIFTAPEPLARLLYPVGDDPILHRVKDEGEELEPIFFAPVVPVLLLNGCRGIASGFSTLVPAYNPLDLIAWVRAWIGGGDTSERPPLIPWYRGYTGKIALRDDQTAWTSRGSLEHDEKTNFWHVRELPVGLWTDKFKEYLETMGSAKRSLLSSIATYNTPNTVHFKFRAVKNFRPSVEVANNLSVLKQVHSLRNMVALDEKGYPLSFKTPEELLEKFCPLRLKLYQKRKHYLLGSLSNECAVAQNKVKFIRAIIEKKLKLNQEDGVLSTRLPVLGISPDSNGSYGYLLNLPTAHVLSKKKLADLENTSADLDRSLSSLQRLSPAALWLRDLKAFETGYVKFLNSSSTRDDC